MEISLEWGATRICTRADFIFGIHQRFNLEEGVTGKILKFADDTKLFRKVKEIGDKQNVQDDIDKFVKWSEKWQMLFNVGKHKCLHTGPGNTGMNYEMGGTILCKTVKEKDLGVTMNANMKVSEQCRIAASKGRRTLYNFCCVGRCADGQQLLGVHAHYPITRNRSTHTTQQKLAQTVCELPRS